MLKLPDGPCLRFVSNPFAASESRPWRSSVRAVASVVPPPEGGGAGPCVATGRGAAMDALGAGVAGRASDGAGGASDAASSGEAEGATLAGSALGVVVGASVGATEGRVGAAAALVGAPPRPR